MSTLMQGVHWAGAYDLCRVDLLQYTRYVPRRAGSSQKVDRELLRKSMSIEFWRLARAREPNIALDLP